MAQTSNFKSYERGTRYQTTQAMFTAGMYYSDTPIPEGAAKVLVNCDVGIDGASIKPRKGLKTTKSQYAGNSSFYNSTKLIYLDSKVCYQNDTEYTQIIFGKHVADSTYEVQAWTCSNPVTIKARAYAVDGVYPKITLADTAQPVGCFINDQYFFFDKNSGTLFYTVFDVSKAYYVLKKLEPQNTSYAQAQQMGFNMLLKNPYTYQDAYVSGESTINFSSINAFDDQACTTPAQQELILNQLYYYRISYSGGGTIKLVFDWTATDTMEWQELTTQTLTINADVLPKIIIPFRASVPKAIIRCTAYSITADADTTGVPLDIIWFSFDYQQEYTKPVKDLYNFTLSTACTMTYWQNRLVVAGVKEDKSYLFMSAPELFEYFPFPNNADYLDEPIVSVQTLLDNLLVFTKSKLYLYTLDPTNGLVRKCIQTNLNISETDVHLIKIVKNMAYFKSGLYYYMVVPKLNSTTGELTIAPVYRNIKELLDAPDQHMQAIIKEVYPEIQTLDFYRVHNYLDYESIHNIYMYKIEEGLYINFDLMYNTVKRVWSIYLYTSPEALHVRKADATKPGDMLCITQVHRTLQTDTSVSYTAYTPHIQLVQWNTEDYRDMLYPHDILKSSKMPRTVSAYNNRQYIDTGYIDINSNYKKRFREVQFRVINNSNESLDFATTFYIDGVSTGPKYEYTSVVDESTGTLTLIKELTNANLNNTHIQGVTRLGSWNLSEDMFPGADIIKVRVPVSGKGYNSQIKINCDSQQDYTLLDITNVYRPLYSR